MPLEFLKDIRCALGQLGIFGSEGRLFQLVPVEPSGSGVDLELDMVPYEGPCVPVLEIASTVFPLNAMWRKG